MNRWDRSRVLLVATAGVAVLALAVAGFSLAALTLAEPATTAGNGSSAATPEPERLLTRQVGSPARTADFSFGHTIGNAVPNQDDPFEASMRLPFELGVDAQEFRVHVRNWQFNAEEAFDSPVTLTGAFVGEHLVAGERGMTGQFAATPVGISGTANLAAEGFVSDWVEPAQATLGAHTPYLLSLGFSTPAGSTLATTPGLSWLAIGGGSASRAASMGETGTRSAALSYFDVWIEYRFLGDAPLLVSIGHSLNAPGNLRSGEFPTRGELTSWPQQWAQSNEAVAVTFASPGAQTSLFADGTELWQEFGPVDELDPDIVTVWAASNDIARGRPIADIKRDWGVLVTRVHDQWPHAVVFAMMEPPRGLAAPQEQTRLAWNTWLSGAPYGIDRVIDADYLLRDARDPSLLRDDVDADGIHFTGRGHSLIASQIPAPRREP
jgi:hypothetical protein